MAYPHTFNGLAGNIPLQYLDDNFNALPASGGSALVGFLQAGTGAVTIDQQTRGRLVRYPQDFGATGNGTVDDRAAIALTDTAGPFVFPPATYRVSSNITIANSVAFMPGASLSIDTGVVVTFSGAITAPDVQIFSGLGTVVLSGKQTAVPEWWGAAPGVNSGAIINKMIAACTANLCPVFFGQTYPVETLVTIPPLLPVTCAATSTFNAAGGAANGVLITTGNCGYKQLPIIAGFTGYGLKLAGTSLANIECQAIANCGDGVVLETINATWPSALDNKVVIQSISNCTNAIRVTANNALNIIQGNEFRVNFSTTNVRTVFYDAAALSPSWDGNSFIFQAVDPFNVANARGLITNAASVSRCTFKCEGWFGGFPAATGKYIDSGTGAFNQLNFDVSLAETPTVYTLVTLGGTGNQFKTRVRAGALTTPVVMANAAASRATFNGGAPLYGDRELLRITIAGANLLPGQIYDAYLYHLKVDGASENWRIEPRLTLGALPITIIDQNATNANEIRIRILNASTANINIGTSIDFYFEIG